MGLSHAFPRLKCSRPQTRWVRVSLGPWGFQSQKELAVLSSAFVEQGLDTLGLYLDGCWGLPAFARCHHSQDLPTAGPCVITLEGKIPIKEGLENLFSLSQIHSVHSSPCLRNHDSFINPIRYHSYFIAEDIKAQRAKFQIQVTWLLTTMPC